MLFSLVEDTTPTTPTPTTPTTDTTGTTADFAAPLPSWLLAWLIVLVVVIIIAMFALTFYNLSAPRSTLKNVLGIKPRWRGRGQHASSGPDPNASGASKPDSRPLDSLAKLAGQGNQKAVSDLIKALSTSARVGTRTTRTTLAIAGFSLLGVVLIAIFGLSGAGVRDLRTQAVAAITTLVASIAGFYFGSRAAGGGTQPAAGQAAPTTAAPILVPDPEPTHAQFTVGSQGAYRPIATGTPSPTIAVGKGTLPDGLNLDPLTGVIIGVPTANAQGVSTVTLTATNGIDPPATLDVTITIS